MPFMLGSSTGGPSLRPPEGRGGEGWPVGGGGAGLRLLGEGGEGGACWGPESEERWRPEGGWGGAR